MRGLHDRQRVRGGGRVLLEVGRPVLLRRADALQSALCGRLRPPSRLYRQHAVAEGCAEYVSGTSSRAYMVVGNVPPQLAVSRPTFASLPSPFPAPLNMPLAPSWRSYTLSPRTCARPQYPAPFVERSDGSRLRSFGEQRILVLRWSQHPGRRRQHPGGRIGRVQMEQGVNPVE